MSEVKTKEDLFKSCISKEIYDKHTVGEVFEIDGVVYATNKHIMIWCDKQHYPYNVVGVESPPNVKSVIKEPNTSRVLHLDKSLFEKYKTEKEYVTVGKYVDCKTCNGDGSVEWTFKHHTKEDDCPDCDGSGYEEEPKRKATGKMWYEYEKGVSIDGVILNIKYIDFLTQIRDVVGGDIELIYLGEKTKGVMFKVAFVSVLILPLINKHETISIKKLITKEASDV